VQYVRIAVGRVLKGPDCIHTVALIAGASNCDYVFRVGESYLLFVQPSDYLAGAHTASMCLPTKPLRTAGSDLEALRKLNDARPVESPRR